MDNPLIAALDQDVRHLFAQFQALSDCIEVVLAFGRGIFNEVVVGQALGVDKDGLRNLDRIVERERANEHRRGFVDDRQPMRELGARLTSMSAVKRRNTSSNREICSSE